jgi:hypothetical protein
LTKERGWGEDLTKNLMFTILAISDSDKHRSSAIQEYEKRLGKLIIIENIKPAKN